MDEYPVSWHGYRDVVKIGEGAHSVVYRAKCGSLESEETVAIKVIDLKKATAGFETIDLDRLQSLQNAHIVVPHTIFSVKRSLWIVMPYMAGGSLRSIRYEMISTSLRYVLRRLLSALLHLQNNGAFHNDVNVSNILIDSPDAEIRLSDHGLSYHSYHAPSPSPTQPPYWHAPENENCNCYVWSFGVAALELAHGYPPLCHLKSIFDPRTKNKMTRDFKDLVSRCLHSDATQRPTLTELASHHFLDNNNSCHDDVNFLRRLMAGQDHRLERFDYKDQYVIKWEFCEPFFGLTPTFSIPRRDGSKFVIADPLYAPYPNYGEHPSPGPGPSWAALESVVLSLKEDVDDMRSRLDSISSSESLKEDVDEMRARADSMEMGLYFLYSLATGGSKLH